VGEKTHNLEGLPSEVIELDVEIHFKMPGHPKFTTRGTWRHVFGGAGPPKFTTLETSGQDDEKVMFSNRPLDLKF